MNWQSCRHGVTIINALLYTVMGLVIGSWFEPLIVEYNNCVLAWICFGLNLSHNVLKKYLSTFQVLLYLYLSNIFGTYGITVSVKHECLTFVYRDLGLDLDLSPFIFCSTVYSCHIIASVSLGYVNAQQKGTGLITSSSSVTTSRISIWSRFLSFSILAARDLPCSTASSSSVIRTDVLRL